MLLIDGLLALVSSVLPSCDLTVEESRIMDATIKALAAENLFLEFGHIQPTAIFARLEIIAIKTLSLAF
jgi:hypothetical protein